MADPPVSTCHAGRASRWHSVSRGTSPTARSSTSASGCLRSSQPICLPIEKLSCTARTDCWAWVRRRSGPRGLRPDQRGQATRDARPRRLLLSPRRQFRDDARRSSRRVRARCIYGFRDRRPGQLAHRRTGFHSRRRWRHGPRHRREAHIRHDGHCTKGGESKLVRNAPYPLTALAAWCVSTRTSR